jgi:ABC-type amino acid transport substrate-binding protein
MAHLLAAELGVGLEFVLVKNDDIDKHLASGRIDVMMGGLLVTPERALDVKFTTPHLNSTLALVVPDYERSRFDTNEKLQKIDSMTIAAANLSYYSKFVQRHLPNVKLVPVDSPREFFLAEPGEFDGLLFSAEAGSAWTLVYPKFTVVVPKPRTVTAPVALGLPRNAPKLYDFVETWLLLQEESGALTQLQRYWLQGEGAESKEPRWSIVRNVLGWTD